MNAIVPVVMAAVAVLRPPIATNDAQLTGQLDAPAQRVRAAKQSVFALQWRQSLVRTGLARDVVVSFGRPAVSTRYNLVIVGTGEGHVEARRLADGRLVWTYQHGAPLESAVTLVDTPYGAGAAVAPVAPTKATPTLHAAAPVFADRELAVIGARDGILLALDAATGALVWKTDVGGDVRAQTTVAGSTLVVATAANRITALDIAKGTIQWTAGRPPPTGLTVVGHARPLVNGDTVYGAFSDGYVGAYALADGGQRWLRSLSLRGSGFLDADADPAIADGKLFVASYTDGVYALDPGTGQTLWQRVVPAVDSLAIHGANVIAGNGDGYVWAFRTRDGELSFRTKIAVGLVTRMVIRDNLLVFAGGDSGLIVLDASSGRPLQVSSLGARMANDLVWERDALAVVSANGYLYAFSRQKTGRVR